MTDIQARRFGTRIVKESDGALIKFGRTNGIACVHAKFPARPSEGENMGSEQRAESMTFYEEVDWEQHPNNRSYNQRKKKKETNDPDIMAAVRNKEAV